MPTTPGTFTAAGTTIAISAGVPATQDQAGYGALTYTEIGNVEKLGSIGATYGKTEFQPLKGAKQKLKTSPDYGSLQPSLGLDAGDAGQALLRTASVSIAWFAFKVIYPTGGIRYFQGVVFGFAETADGADSAVMATPTVEINTPVVVVAGA